ncbi:MAG: hypothetical protein ACI8RD_002099 [Bacillariaceae sp.]|jgi:hypothetical protein
MTMTKTDENIDTTPIEQNNNTQQQFSHPPYRYSFGV